MQKIIDNHCKKKEEHERSLVKPNKVALVSFNDTRKYINNI